MPEDVSDVDRCVGMCCLMCRYTATIKTSMDLLSRHYCRHDHTNSGLDFSVWLHGRFQNIAVYPCLKGNTDAAFFFHFILGSLPPSLQWMNIMEPPV